MCSVYRVYETYLLCFYYYYTLFSVPWDGWTKRRATLDIVLYSNTKALDIAYSLISLPAACHLFYNHYRLYLSTIRRNNSNNSKGEKKSLFFNKLKTDDFRSSITIIRVECSLSVRRHKSVDFRNKKCSMLNWKWLICHMLFFTLKRCRQDQIGVHSTPTPWPFCVAFGLWNFGEFSSKPFRLQRIEFWG